MSVKPPINLILILGSALVFALVFLVFNSSQSCFGFYSHTLLEMVGGIPLIMLSIGVMFCALHQKKMQTVIFFTLSLLLSCGYIFGLITDIIDGWGSTTYNKPGLGFYLLLLGQVVMIASFLCIAILPTRVNHTSRNNPCSASLFHFLCKVTIKMS